MTAQVPSERYLQPVKRADHSQSGNPGTSPFPAENRWAEREPMDPVSAAADFRTVLIRRTVRSGQSIHYPGNIVVMGDVNPGAELVAGGNIVVMGHLRGMAHAGATGNEQAVVAAFRLTPTQLRIANHITRAPDGEGHKPDQPEVARIHGGAVIIERYPATGVRNLNG